MKRINEGNDVNKNSHRSRAPLAEKVVLQSRSPKVHQPYGILHAGCPLMAEAPRRSRRGERRTDEIVVGTSSTARPALDDSGTLTATATPCARSHRPRWAIDLTDETVA